MTTRAIDAAWPEWWSEEIAGSPAAAAELRYTLARRLGLAPASLFDGPPKFIWRDEARYKNLSASVEASELEALTSFGVSFARLLLSASPGMGPPEFRSAISLREAILASSAVVSLGDLLALCWGVGIPVVHATFLPTRRKNMAAMAVQVGGRFAVILGKADRFAARVAFRLAHELGHIFLGHLGDVPAVVDVGDPLKRLASDNDHDEQAADQFALAVLTGSQEPDVATSLANFNAPTLAAAAMEAGPRLRIDPGTLALAVGYKTGRWRQTSAALSMMPNQEDDVATGLNRVAISQLELAALSSENVAYVRRVLDMQG